MTENENYEYAYFGGGCFWCIEATFEGLEGVSSVISGYAGGNKETANYQSVSSGMTQHAEICKIQYDPKIISYETLLKVFFLAHDPTTLNRQGNDIGLQYRSVIFFKKKIEQQIVYQYIKKLYEDSIYTNIQTEITHLNEFYPAETYHQNYFQSNKKQPYCTLVIEPKIQKLRKKLRKYYR